MVSRGIVMDVVKSNWLGFVGCHVACQVALFRGSFLAYLGVRIKEAKVSQKKVSQKCVVDA